jgi:uncharacterized membrane-anchored protein
MGNREARTMRVVAGLGALVSMTLALHVRAQEPATEWVSGPTSVDLGASIAALEVGKEFAFANATDTRRLLEQMGNTTDGTEVGLIVPKAEDQDWMMVFEWSPVGYVKDDDKDSIDKDAILKSYQDGTEAANEERKKRGLPGLHVVGWFEEPHYDEKTHNLVWALKGRNDNGHESVNFNMRLLGRDGYMSVTLIDEPSKLASSKPYVASVLSGFNYKSGKSYAEFRSGDKVAEYGLAALVAGGTAAAAAKLGLFAIIGKFFAKAGKGIVIAILAVGAFLKKAWNAITRRGEQ